MPNLPISSLPELTAITATAEYVVELSGTTYKIKQETLSPLPTVYGLYSQTGNSVIVSATTVESSVIGGGVGTLTVPENGFKIGDSFRADFGGLLSSKNNDTIRLRIKAGSVVLADSLAQTLTASVGDVFQLVVNFTIRKIGGPKCCGNSYFRSLPY